MTDEQKAMAMMASFGDDFAYKTLMEDETLGEDAKEYLKNKREQKPKTICFSVGDWAKVNENKFRVRGIYENGGSIFVQTDVHELCYKYCALEPIPLTDEILKKNGINEKNICYTFNSNVLQAIEMKYVHQLQQAIRLCGIEKDIIL